MHKAFHNILLGKDGLRDKKGLFVMLVLLWTVWESSRFNATNALYPTMLTFCVDGRSEWQEIELREREVR